MLELYAEVTDFPLKGLNVQKGRQGIYGGEAVLYKDQQIFD
jgi:hypothetical protein